MSVDLENIRREYRLDGLRRKHLDQNPLQQFERWLQQAIESKIPDPTAMTLATVSDSGQPSQRIVLLKLLDTKGFVFFTNYQSVKANEIAANSKVSLHFPWHAMDRQVRVGGVAEKISIDETLKYFISRPRESQLAAWASQQSRPLNSRQALIQQFDAMKDKFVTGDIPVPDFWGGYRVIPKVFEFWQGGGARLHDRFEYVLDEALGLWQIQRLAP